MKNDIEDSFLKVVNALIILPGTREKFLDLIKTCLMNKDLSQLADIYKSICHIKDRTIEDIKDSLIKKIIEEIED